LIESFAVRSLPQALQVAFEQSAVTALIQRDFVPVGAAAPCKRVVQTIRVPKK
jgi:hypothetical protein